MTLTTDQRTAHVDGTARRVARWQVAALVAAPAVALTARLLNTPWYQDANKPDHLRVLDDVAASATANDLGALLTLVSGLLYAAAAVATALLVRQAMPRAGTAGALLGVVGGFGLAVFADQLAIVGQAARLTEHRDAMLALLQQNYEAPLAGVAYLLLVLGALGWVLLAIALYRTRAVPRAAAVLVGLGGAAVMLTTPGPLVSFIAGAAVVSLVGLWWVAAARRR